MDNMIYDFKTHGLYYEKQNNSVSIFSLSIDTLEVVFELQTGKLVGVSGYLPLTYAIKCNISIPVCEKKEYVLKNTDLSSYEQGAIYDMIRMIPQTKKYDKKGYHSDWQ